MKKPKAQYQYRWKFKIQGKKALMEWGGSMSDACKPIVAYFKSLGYIDAKFSKIGPGRHLIRLIKKYKYGQEAQIVYVTKLPTRRIKPIIVE